MESEAKPRRVAFDAVEIDLVGRRVTIAGIEAALEPKAFDVLALLAQAPGKAFTRDEILDAVWGHRHVTPGALNRVILLIRQALGDSADALHTLRGVGYRFDGEVRQISQQEVANKVLPTVNSSADVAALQTMPASIPAVPQRAQGPASIDAMQPEEAEPGTTWLPAGVNSRRFSSFWRWTLVVGLSTLAIGVFFLRPIWQHETPTSTTSPTLVVLPLHAIGDEKKENVFADGLSEELTTQLAQVDGLRTISSISAARAQRDGFDAVQLAERLHVTHALEGSLREAGERLRIDLRLIETPSGRTVWSQNYDRTTNDVFDTQQEIAQAVASALSLRMKLAHSPSPPPDPEVFRDYLALRHLFMAHSTGPDYEKAEVALNALAARAPNFAPVHGLLALNLASRFEPGREQEALPEAKRALEIDPDSTYAHAALGELACFRNEWNDCMKELRTALALNPTDSIMNLIVGMRLARLGYGDEALRHFKIAHATDPLSYWTNANLGTELEVLDRPEEARPYLDTLQSLDPAAPLTGGLRWYNAILRNDFAGAHDIASQMSDRDAWKAGYLALSDAFASPAAWPEATKVLRATQEKTGRPHWLLSLIPQPDVANVLHMYEDNNHFGGKFIWSRELVAIRPDPAFSDFLRRTKTIDYWNANGWPPQCKPDGDGARCD